MEETFKHKLDLYYLSTIAYTMTLIVYVLMTGWFIESGFVEVRKDPVVYGLAICAAISLITLIIAAMLRRTVIVRPKELVFRTRYKERVFGPEDIEWISFGMEERAPYRSRGVYPAARIKFRQRRRRTKLRSGSFERSPQLMRTLKQWALDNGVTVRDRRPSRRSRRQ